MKKDVYEKTVVPALQEKFGYKNVMQIPRLQKIVINISLPRVRDFRGLPRRGFDGSGNYTLGIKEQSIFVEIDIDKISTTLGMDISFVTSAKTDEEGRALLEGLGLPFRK